MVIVNGNLFFYNMIKKKKKKKKKKIRPVKEIKIYRNTYDNAISTYKDVKVELSTEFPNFEEDKTAVVFEKQDIESRESRGKPQIINLDKAIDAQYIRIWGKGTLYSEYK